MEGWGGVAERPTAVPLTEMIITNRKIHPSASRKQDYSICIFGQHIRPHLLYCANAVKVRQELLHLKKVNKAKKARDSLTMKSLPTDKD